MIASPADIQQAAAILEAGGLVAIPTETVYGLGADAENPTAIARIYAAKGRPADHPVIVHLAPAADLEYWAASIPALAHKLIAAYWPGPLTLILRRAPHIPDSVSGGQDTIGLRCPSHPVARTLLDVFKRGRGGIAAPSANKFGRVSPTSAQHVRDEFGVPPQSGLDCILDGGQSEVGIESTILDLSRLATHGPVLLRPGHIAIEHIAELTGARPALPDAAAPRASGTLESHYAPHTPVALVDAKQIAEIVKKLVLAGRRIALMRCGAGFAADAVAQIAMPEEPAGYAHDLYAALRAMDLAGADLIVIQAPPSAPSWQAVNDRLRRAAHDSIDILKRFF